MRLDMVDFTRRSRPGRALRRGWEGWDASCARLERFHDRLGVAYAGMWRRGWPSWGHALLLAPVAVVALLVLVVAGMLARLAGLVVAAAVLLIQATVVAAPIVAAVLALASLTGDDSRPATAAAATQ